jgi:hypothetical protein
MVVHRRHLLGYRGDTAVWWCARTKPRTSLISGPVAAADRGIEEYDAPDSRTVPGSLEK